MDPAILSATAALVGSLVGGVSTFAASWLTQRWQLHTQTLMQQAVKRETLYAEFIIEASRRFTDAWNHQAEGPEVLASLFSVVERMRLISSSTVISAAEQVLRNVAEAYADPNQTFDEFRERVGKKDPRNPLRDFTEACREELRALRS
jgi:hypothetical protein